MTEDLPLFDAWCLGDRKAGAELFDRYYEPLARFFRNKVDEDARDDLLQSVFLACVERRAQVRDHSSFRGYLFAVAHHQLCKHYRGKHRTPELIDLDAISASQLGVVVGDGWTRREEQQLLLRALRHIPVDCQAVLELHYWERMGTAEIAEVVGAPQGTVKSRLQRGRQLLEEQMRALAPTPAVLDSTLSGLDRWAASVREGMARAPNVSRPPGS